MEPNPMMIESFYRITGKDRTPWDCETLLLLAIARQSMQHKAMKKDCERPYYSDASPADLTARNESVVGSFFNRFTGNDV